MRGFLVVFVAVITFLSMAIVGDLQSPAPRTPYQIGQQIGKPVSVLFGGYSQVVLIVNTPSYH